ncbi:MAG: gluconate:H+ symporter [Verrucomicrobiales bacterium]
MPSSTTTLLLLAVAAIAVLVVLVTWRKWNAFIALFVASLVVGVGGGLGAMGTLKHFQDGIGATMGGIAAVIALGAMLGKLLAESGAAQVLAERFNAFFGPARVGWCVAALAVAVGLVTWFAVGLLLLVPVIVTLAHESRRPFLLLAIPLLSFLSVMHGLMPPHPGPVAAVAALGANTGAVLGWGFLIGLPTAAVAGPWFARMAVRYVRAEPPAMAARLAAAERPKPSFGATLFVVCFPIGLMLLGTLGELVLPTGNDVRGALVAIGHPVFALVISVLAAAWLFQRACGFTRGQLLGFTEQSVSGIGMALLVVAGGGGFARVLREAKVADAMGEVARVMHLPPLVYAWLVAAFIRVATGSATVAIMAAAGVMAPVLKADPTLNKEMLVLAIGCGSLFLSHLNDGGFWIVKESLGLTVGQTLRTWTVTETLIGLIGLVLVLAVNAFL